MPVAPPAPEVSVLPAPGDEEPIEGLLAPPNVGVPAEDPVPPYPGVPNAEGEAPADPAAPAPAGPAEAIPAAVPNPGVNPASGCPKNPFTVVLASPTLISRQSGFPVIGSAYRCRRNRILFVFSRGTWVFAGWFGRDFHFGSGVYRYVGVNWVNWVYRIYRVNWVNWVY